MSSGIRIIELVTPVRGLLPEVEPPLRKNLAFREKMLWTAIVLFVYLICC